MSFDVVIRKKNGELEVCIRNEWIKIKKYSTEIDKILNLEEGEERIISSSNIIAVVKFYENKSEDYYENNHNNTKNEKLNSKIVYVF